MSRSLKKGPYVDAKLLKKVGNQKAATASVIRTWARNSQIAPEFVGFTFAVHNVAEAGVLVAVLRGQGLRLHQGAGLAVIAVGVGRAAVPRRERREQFRFCLGAGDPARVGRARRRHAERRRAPHRRRIHPAAAAIEDVVGADVRAHGLRDVDPEAYRHRR